MLGAPANAHKLPALSLIFCEIEGVTEDEATSTLLDLAETAWRAIEALDDRFEILKTFTYVAGYHWVDLATKVEQLEAHIAKQDIEPTFARQLMRAHMQPVNDREGRIQRAVETYWNAMPGIYP